MKQYLFGPRFFGIGVAAAIVAAVSAPAALAAPAPSPQAAAPSPQAAASVCAEPAISQPFAALHDTNWYTLAPGEQAGGFDAVGWTLTGGAHIVSTTLGDGTTADVLDLPAGSSATSPAMCVDGNYPIARMQARSLGKAPDNSTKFSVAPVGGGPATGAMPVLGTTSWALTPPVNVATANSGAEQVTFTLTAGSKAADLQVYNLYIDPRMCH